MIVCGRSLLQRNMQRSLILQSFRLLFCWQLHRLWNGLSQANNETNFRNIHKPFVHLNILVFQLLLGRWKSSRSIPWACFPDYGILSWKVAWDQCRNSSNSHKPDLGFSRSYLVQQLSCLSVLLSVCICFRSNRYAITIYLLILYIICFLSAASSLLVVKRLSPISKFQAQFV